MNSQGNELLVKADGESDPKYGKPPIDRTLAELMQNGLIILDKPSGPTSHQVTAWVRDILELKKIGHGGTLDPKVTGVLPLALENSTKAMKLLLESNKEYIGIMRLHNDAKGDRLSKLFQEFTGEIYQIPPVRSAVKRQLRTRTIFELELLEIIERDVLFRVSCDAGTYIRTLVNDIGTILGTGAHMRELRRTRSGNFFEENAVTLHDIKDAFMYWQEDGDETQLRAILHPLELVLEPLPKLIIRDSAVSAVCHGASLAVPGILQLDRNITPNKKIAIMTLKGEAVGIGKALVSSERIMEKKDGLAAEIERVLMPIGIYPKVWRSSKDKSG
jgi:H/ACA ribonucleoprotein complex subunit 4